MVGIRQNLVSKAVTWACITLPLTVHAQTSSSVFETAVSEIANDFYTLEKAVFDNGVHTPNTINLYVKPGQKTPAHIDFPTPVTINGAKESITNADWQEVACDVIDGLKPHLLIDHPMDELTVSDVAKHKGFTHISLQQHYRGIPIFGGVLKMHVNPDGEIASINGNSIPSPEKMPLQPEISKASAIQIFKDHLDIDGDGREQMLGFSHDEASLVILPHFGLNILAWKLRVFENPTHSWEVLVSANTGEVLRYYNTVCHGLPTSAENATGYDNAKGYYTTSAQTYQTRENGAYYLLDASRVEPSQLPSSGLPNNGSIRIWNAEGWYLDAPKSLSTFQSFDNTFGKTQLEAEAVACQNHLNTAFAYFAHGNTNKIQWIEPFFGIDGKNELPIRAYVNAGLSNDFRIGFNGAMWLPAKNLMIFGNGGKYLKHTCASLDFVAHEFTHGIVSHTAQLLGSGEAAAINEAIADIMALTIAKKSSGTRRWYFGSETLKDFKVDPQNAMDQAMSGPCIRNLANPHNGFSSSEPGYHYAHLDEIRTTGNSGYMEDWDVYHQSTIISHAFYLMVKHSKTNNGKIIQLDQDQIAAMFFNAMRYYLTPDANFADYAKAVINACMAEFGRMGEQNGKRKWEMAREAFEAVGIYLPREDLSKFKLNPVVGKSYILAQKTELDRSVASYDTKNFEEIPALLTAISTPKSEISTTDDGRIGYYVNLSGNIRRLDLSSFNTNSDQVQQIEFEVDLAGKWKSVAVSPRGQKLALVKEAYDSSLYVYHIEQKKLVRFKLSGFYHLLDDHGNELMMQPVRIGSINWNYNGEDIMFDCQNIPILPSYDEYTEHWNIAKMQVWDNSLNTFGKGEIQAPIAGKLLSYIQYRNPAFAKNDPDIIVYDQYNFKKHQNTIYAYHSTDIGSGPSPLAQSPILAQPCYSNDDRSLAYTTLNALGDTVIQILSLDSTSLRTLDIPEDLLAVNRKFPVWFTIGDRKETASGIKDIENADQSPSVAISLYPNPVAGYLHLDALHEDDRIEDVQILSITGELHQRHNTNSANVRINVSSLPAGQYIVRYRSGDTYQSQLLVKQ